MIPNIMKIMISAIRDKRCVAIRYHDQRHVRVIEPHVIYTHESGELIVDAYQTRGYSASGRPPPYWRPFRLKKINAISILKESFETREQEGFARDKNKYRRGLVAMIDDRRTFGGVPKQGMAIQPKPQVSAKAPPPFAVGPAEEVGPQLPKNPFRR